MANGTIIFQVKAVDADFGNNSIVTYNLSSWLGEYSGKFAIDASSGNITLIGELDHENAREIRTARHSQEIHRGCNVNPA